MYYYHHYQAVLLHQKNPRIGVVQLGSVKILKLEKIRRKQQVEMGSGNDNLIMKGPGHITGGA